MFTSEEESRIEAIEKTLNNIQIALNAVATVAQLNQVMLIRQQDIIDLQNRVTSLESEVAALQNLIH